MNGKRRKKEGWKYERMWMLGRIKNVLEKSSLNIDFKEKSFRM
jgi:hypothetical protein